MPIYEYACKDCGSKFEAMRSMKDADAPIACHACNSKHTARMLSLFNAQSDGRSLAGSGASCGSCSSSSCGTCGSG